jgi:hypothetical protein
MFTSRPVLTGSLAQNERAREKYLKKYFATHKEKLGEYDDWTIWAMILFLNCLLRTCGLEINLPNITLNTVAILVLHYRPRDKHARKNANVIMDPVRIRNDKARLSSDGSSCLPDQQLHRHCFASHPGRGRLRGTCTGAGPEHQHPRHLVDRHAKHYSCGQI